VKVKLAIVSAALVLANSPGTATAQDLRPFPKAQNPVPADASRLAGGSGIVPLMAMLRHRAAAKSRIPARLLYSVRTRDDLIYDEELRRLEENDPSLEVIRTLTRERPEGWSGYTRRIDREMLEAVSWTPGEAPRIFVCGPTALVEMAATHFREMGHAPERIKTERFGPTGGP
jgi:ferredoxin-NADP reductase